MVGPAWYLATHWTSGGELPKSFLIMMLGVTYGLIVLLGVVIYRVLRGGGDAGAGTGDEGPERPDGRR